MQNASANGYRINESDQAESTKQVKVNTNPYPVHNQQQCDNRDDESSVGSDLEQDPTSSNRKKNPASLNSWMLGNKEQTVVVGALILIIAIWISNSGSRKCDMGIAENRDFNQYYGIYGLSNHFANPTADKCNSHTIFRPALPQAILKADHSASSFLTLATYGTGKTLLRCEYSRTLQTNEYFQVVILNKEVDEYLRRYIDSKGFKQDTCQSNFCLIGWSDRDFAQLALSVLVTNLINTYENTLPKLDRISESEKIELITILCYYYNGLGTSQLENFVNSFLNIPKKTSYAASTAQTQNKERDVYYDKELFIHFRDNLKTLNVLNSDDYRLRLLLAVIEGEEFTRVAKNRNMTSSVFDDLTQLSLFLKNHLKRTVVFIIDGIDENRYFFHKREVQKAALETFGRSSVSEELLAKAMAHHFYLSIFYPKITGINIEDAIIKKDKFPTYGIMWNTKSLMNYADYVLQQLNHNASSSRCKPIPDFKTLVKYANKKVAEIVDKIDTPRALHYLMNELITEMNHDAATVSEPFIATFENVYNAYQTSYAQHHQRHTIKE